MVYQNGSLVGQVIDLAVVIAMLGGTLTWIVDGRVVELAVVDRSQSLLHAMGDTNRDRTSADAALAVIGLKGNLIDAAVALSRSFGSNRGRTSLDYRIGTCVAIALPVDWLILAIGFAFFLACASCR